MTARHALTDAQWARVQPLLPPTKPRTGRPNRNHRLLLDAILWKLRTGAPWRDLPERFGSWKTVDSRFRRWSRDGRWRQIRGKGEWLGEACLPEGPRRV